MTCQLRPPICAAGFRVTRAGAQLRSLALGEEAHHARLPHARGVPRGLWLFHALRKATAPARGLSPSVQDCGAT